MSSTRTGMLYAAAAFGAWGAFPAYWRLLDAVPPPELLAWRVAGAAVFVVGLLAAGGRLALARAELPRVRSFALPAIAIGANWGIYIAAVNSSHVLETSLGYFISPLLSVALGVVVFRERLRRAQQVAVAIATAGVFVAGFGFGRPPWIALALAGTFGLYGVLHKRQTTDALVSLAWETLLLAPLAVAALIWWLAHGEARAIALDGPHQAVLAAAGALTALPLLWFGHAARRLPLSVLGLLQYLSPTGQFAIALAFGEPLTPARAVSFACIWAALGVFSWDSWSGRARAPAA